MLGRSSRSRHVLLRQISHLGTACNAFSWYTDILDNMAIFLQSPQRQVVDFLQKLCSNNIDIAVGTLTPTGMHNEHGGYESDCILGRAAENKLVLVNFS